MAEKGFKFTVTGTETSAYFLFLPGRWGFYVSYLVSDQVFKCLINSKSMHKVCHLGINPSGFKNLQEEYATGRRLPKGQDKMPLIIYVQGKI